MNLKKLLFVFAIFVTFRVNAQNYLISFEGNGASNIVSTVKVENLTSGISLTLSGTDILDLTFTTFVNPIQGNQPKLKIYPNPMSDNSTLEFLPEAAGNAKITIYDLNGKPIAQINSYLENINQNFKLSGFKQGFYLINVVGHGYKTSGKLVSNGQSDGTITIEKVIDNYQPVSEKKVKNDIKGHQGPVEMNYTAGDILKFTATSGDCVSVVLDIPTSSKIIAFHFTRVPSLNTSVPTNISSTAVTSGGTVTSDGGASIIACGVCWSTTAYPTISLNTKTLDGATSGSFISNITGLQPFTSYHVRAYATNSEGTDYGDDVSFTTSAIVPSLTTTTAFQIGRTTANSGGIITSNGGAAVSVSGVCWDTVHSPSIAGSHTTDGTANGSFTSNITGLLPNTSYHIRAYATNNAGTSYGNELSFTTNPIIIPTLTSTIVTAISSESAVSGGSISDNGGASITARGVCWSTTSSPTINDDKTSNGTGKGSFTSHITGLQPGTIYHVRAYSTNSAGTAYGNDRTFTTSVTVPSVTTSQAYAVTQTTASSGGSISSNGGATVSASGICWGTSNNPLITDSHTSDGIEVGDFTSSLTDLLPNTLYYIRAYATNSVGTSYGNEISFTTMTETSASLSTTPVTSIASTTAKTGGTITNDGNGPVTGRGVCWATTPSPTIGDDFTSNGTGFGSFTSNLTGLTPNTRYYVRAYAVNSLGTIYGNEVTFIYLIPEINSCKWLKDASCFLNLSFDDTQAAHLKVANLLDVYGFKGSFYAQSIEFEYQPELIDVYNTILNSGHEVGSHTVNHLDLTSLDEQQLLYEIDSSVSRIDRYLNIKCTSIANPYHSTNDHINNIIFSHNLFERNYSEYYTSRRSRFDLNSETMVSDVTNFIDVQIANNSSGLITGHGIDGMGYSPNTTEFFNQLFTYIAGVQNSKKVWVTTVSNGSLYESLFNEVNLTSHIDQSNRQIKIKFDCPDKTIYNNFSELLYSFKIDKSSFWSIPNSDIEFIETDTQYIYTIDLKQMREVTLQYIITP
jgi:peptidoglycan/xylan/chitin deacetylase (PgdA/CDA1 family)